MTAIKNYGRPPSVRSASRR